MAGIDKLDQIVKSSIAEQPAEPEAAPVSSAQPDVDQLQQLITQGDQQRIPALQRFTGGIMTPTESLLQTLQRHLPPGILGSVSPALGLLQAPGAQSALQRLRQMTPQPTGIAGGIGQIIGATPLFAAPETAAAEIPTALGRVAARILGQAGIGGAITPEAPLRGAITGGIAGTAGEIVRPVLTGLKGLLTQPIQTAKSGFNRLLAGTPGGLNGVRLVVKDRLGNIAHDLSKGISTETASTPESVQQDLFNKIVENRKNASDLASTSFDILNQNPAGQTFRFDLTDTPKTLKNKLIETSDKLKLLEGTGDVSEAREKELQQWLQGKMNFSNRIKNLNESKIFRESLNADRNDNQLMERLPVLKRIIPEIKKNLDNELENKIEGSGNEPLLNAWRTANEQYKNFKQIFDVDDRTGKTSKLSKLVGVENPNISQFFNSLIKPSVKNDDISGINELFSYLPDQADREKVAFNIIKDEDPEKAIKNYAKLGNNQKDLLFPQHREELDQLEAAQKRFPSAFSIPKELTSQGKLFEATRIGGAIAAAPFTKGLSLLVGATPLFRSIAQRPGMSRALLQDILRRTAAESTESKLGRISLLRPLLTSLGMKTGQELQQFMRR